MKVFQVFAALLIPLLSIGQNCQLTPTPISFNYGSVGPIIPSMSGPIKITQGGTYCGKWSSNSQAVPVIQIETDECVIIENSVLYGVGTIIVVSVADANLTIRNCYVFGMDPENPTYQDHIGWPHDGSITPSLGNFLWMEQTPDKVSIENNYIERTIGINIHGGQPEGPIEEGLPPEIMISKNIFKNIDGRVVKSDGSGLRQIHFGGRYAFAINLINIPEPIIAEISKNQIINRANESGVEDNINLYNVYGFPDNYIKIRDNFIWGAYPFGRFNAPPNESDAFSTKGYSGGGINAADGPNVPYDRCNPLNTMDMRYVEVYDNVVVGTSNYGISATTGRDISIHDNTILASGEAPSDPNDPTVFTDIEAQNSPPNQRIYQSRGIRVMPYQDVGWIAEKTRFVHFWEGGEPSVWKGGRQWKEGLINQNLVVKNNSVWWRYRDFDPFGPGSNSESGYWDGPPNNVAGFRWADPWMWSADSQGSYLSLSIPCAAVHLHKGFPPSPSKTNIDTADTRWYKTWWVSPNNTFLSDPITYQDEKDAFEAWKEKLISNGEAIGPNNVIEISSIPLGTPPFNLDQIVDRIEITFSGTISSPSPLDIAATRSVEVFGSSSGTIIKPNITLKIDYKTMDASGIQQYNSFCGSSGNRIAEEVFPPEDVMEGSMEPQFSEIRVHPNPSNSGLIHFEANNKISNWQVYSLHGALIKQNQNFLMNSGQVKLAPGMYIMKFSVRGEVISTKIIVN